MVGMDITERGGRVKNNTFTQEGQTSTQSLKLETNNQR